MGVVSYIRVREDVFSAVEKAMTLADWKNHVTGKKVFLKVNALSHQVIPGLCTSPWVLEAVVKVLKKEGKEIYVGDANVATINQLEKAAENWRYKEICKKHGATFVNLSNEKTRKVEVDGLVFKEIEIPEILFEVDSKITLPVLKTHNVTTMTCALKNQWGCIPKFRHQYHLVAHQCIADVNKAVSFDFCVADATVCMEGSGPRTGKPKVMDAVMASGDLVSMDAFAAKLIGLNAGEVGYIRNAEKLRVGSMWYKIVGDEVVYRNFEPALAKNHPIVSTELFLRQIPLLSDLIFKTGFFHLPAWIAARYNTVIWHHLKGKEYARDLVEKNKFYAKEFEDLIE
jgi:uncharacterized protein (DUF362 family)